jgi:competence protein ComGC
MSSRQRGFAVLELLLVVLIATLLAVWASSSLVQKINDSHAQGSAAWMLTARKAVQIYIERYADALMQADHAGFLANKGYADWAAPTLTELKSDHLLAPGFPETGVQGAGLLVRVVRQGAACPGPDCRVEALVYSALPYLHRATQLVDEQMVAQWMLASQGWGGMVAATRPERISGPAFQFDNPPGPGAPLPPGTVALAVTSQQPGMQDFLRVRDARDPDFKGRATIQEELDVGKSAYVRGYLRLGFQGYEYDPCPESGAVAREYMGGLLVCDSLRWRSAGRGGGGGYAINSRYGCKTSGGGSTANPVTRACSCPAGHASVIISDSGAHSADEGRTTGFLCVG